MPDFSNQLNQYKQAIDADIAVYAEHVRQTTKPQYGEYGALVTEAFLDLLERGGKRIRGALVMAGYEMCGGQDRQMIIRAATALEMVHAHLLIIDDIQDRSTTRRGRPTVHKALAAYHRRHGLGGDAEHTGIGLALDAAFGGNAAAQMLLAGLDVDAELKLKALGIVNLTVVVTAHGQTQDIMNEVAKQVTTTDVLRTMEWKTANYTILNPLCVGMTLAGAGCEDTDAIRSYALPTGLAFQITDDLIGTFGESEKTGKSNMDDIREGKQTLLTVYALQHAPAADRAFLRRHLGNDQLKTADFKRCQQIIKDCGAYDYAYTEAQRYANQAVSALEDVPAHWGHSQVAFLRELTQALTSRVK
jgi:geranylgeranyl diphosphate synthase, type I